MLKTTAHWRRLRFSYTVECFNSRNWHLRRPLRDRLSQSFPVCIMAGFKGWSLPRYCKSIIVRDHWEFIFSLKSTWIFNLFLFLFLPSFPNHNVWNRNLSTHFENLGSQIFVNYVAHCLKRNILEILFTLWTPFWTNFFFWKLLLIVSRLSYSPWYV